MPSARSSAAPTTDLSVPVFPTRRRCVAGFALLPLLPGCARHLPRPGTEVPLDLLPAERLLLEREDPSAPLALVLDDLPAGDRFLRARAAEVDPHDPMLPLLVERMRASLLAAGGVGIAAPQVGVGRRVVLVQRQDRAAEGEPPPVEACVNPRIVSLSAARVIGWEGCLSVPAGFGQVERAASVVVAWDRVGGGQEREEVGGWTARIFQHEVDHLDGVLFFDRMADPVLLPEPEYREMRRREREAAAAGQAGTEAEPAAPAGGPQQGR